MSIRGKLITDRQLLDTQTLVVKTKRMCSTDYLCITDRLDAVYSSRGRYLRHWLKSFENILSIYEVDSPINSSAETYHCPRISGVPINSYTNGGTKPERGDGGDFVSVRSVFDTGYLEASEEAG